MKQNTFKGENILAKRYKSEPTKKTSSHKKSPNKRNRVIDKRKVLAVIIIIAIITGVIIAINKAKENYIVEEISSADINYYKIISDGKSGVIDKDGKVIIEPEYNTIKIPNPKKLYLSVYMIIMLHQVNIIYYQANITLLHNQKFPK